MNQVRPKADHTVAVDLMGGDYAPGATIDGCVLALERGASILAFGDQGSVEKLNSIAGRLKLETVVCDEVISAEDSPVRAIRAKKDSTIVQGLSAVKNKKAGAFVSAGSTGALLAGGVLIIRRSKVVERPCLATLLPSNSGRGTLFMDLGASADVRSGTLVDFGLMGKIYAERVLGRSDPKIGLLNIGTEKDKGNMITRKAYELMKKAPMNFIGNIEARDVFFDKVDVVVTDGFTGNIFLKTCEGTASFQLKTLKKHIGSNLLRRLCALFLRPAFEKAIGALDYSTYGGAPMLGLEGCLVKCHGSSNARAIANGIGQALRFLEGDVSSVISNTLMQIDSRESE